MMKLTIGREEVMMSVMKAAIQRGMIAAGMAWALIGWSQGVTLLLEIRQG
ncbi:MAG: hypothetical protein M2R45_02167 [Verrucomicrobia subdivision 3 bacterium]|nr:hypothetical protein [Limisphaerales bacterium]MCS1413743.1 hypothetical protein [Limisphaerales bacterium]